MTRSADAESVACQFCDQYVHMLEPNRVLVGDDIGCMHTECLHAFVSVCRLDGTRLWVLVRGIWKRAS